MRRDSRQFSASIGLVPVNIPRGTCSFTRYAVHRKQPWQNDASARALLCAILHNHNSKRTGTLWEGRYRATLIDSEHYLLTCLRYIELNPVRADHRADHPCEYAWSSYRYHALGQSNPLVTPHREYKRLGTTGAERQAAYRQLFRARIPETTLEAIREATNKAWVLGSERFKRRIAKQLDRPLTSGGHGGRPQI
jgi:putative transposase